MKYEQYKYLTDQMTRLHRKIMRLDKSAPAYKEMLKTFISGDNPCMSQTLEPCVLLDEFILSKFSNKVIVPESKDVLDVLSRSKFKFDEGMRLVTPHRAFVFMMPKGYSVDGIALPSCLVSYDSPAGRSKAFEKMKEIYGVDPRIKLDQGSAKSEDRSLFIGFNTVGDAYARCSIPSNMIGDVLKVEPENLYDVLPMYSALFASKVSEMEKRQQAILVRLVCAMSVFIQCRPEYLEKMSGMVRGIPGDMYSQYLPGNAETVFLRDFKSGGGSKSIHYRSWYFRHYPLKTDGTRKEGWVFVTDTMVNEDGKVDILHLNK